MENFVIKFKVLRDEIVSCFKKKYGFFIKKDDFVITKQNSPSASKCTKDMIFRIQKVVETYFEHKEVRYKSGDEIIVPLYNDPDVTTEKQIHYFKDVIPLDQDIKTIIKNYHDLCNFLGFAPRSNFQIFTDTDREDDSLNYLRLSTTYMTDFKNHLSETKRKNIYNSFINGINQLKNGKK